MRHYLRFVSPFVFTFFFSTDLVIFNMVGGLGSFWGRWPAPGSALLTALGEQLFAAGYYKSLVYAVVLLVVILALPGGLIQLPHAREAWAARRLRAAQGARHRGRAMTAVLEVRGIAKQFGGLARSTAWRSRWARASSSASSGRMARARARSSTSSRGPCRPTRGQVLLRGRDVTDLSSHDRARHGIARTFQQVTLFSELTALDNVLQGLHRHVPSRFVAGVPGTPAYRREQREIEAPRPAHPGVARHRRPSRRHRRRAAARDPEAPDAWRWRSPPSPTVLLLDEPAAGLSHEESMRMMDLVSTVIRERCTIVLVEHNMRIVSRYCDRAVVLHFGQKIYDGAPGGLTADQRVVDAYLGVAELG